MLNLPLGVMEIVYFSISCKVLKKNQFERYYKFGDRIHHIYINLVIVFAKFKLLQKFIDFPICCRVKNTHEARNSKFQIEVGIAVPL
jgi:hypothetical protein